MNYIDVFNGDADGIISLLQLRHTEPQRSMLVTGVKRDIQLLDRVSAQPGDFIAVLDISLKSNRSALDRVLDEGANVLYFDHHQPGEIPHHPALVTKIDPSPEVCTSLLVDRYLNGHFRDWAIAAAFGDNLLESATQLAESSGFSSSQTEQLKELGTLVNYNGYGRHIDDLHIHPAELYRQLSQYQTPFDLLKERRSVFTQLQQAYQQDMTNAESLKPHKENDVARMYLLPNAPWSRRVSGVFGNQLTYQNADKAHAVVFDNGDQTYTISVRAPLNNRQGASHICGQFPSGGGREAAAGVNLLPHGQLEQFWSVLTDYYQSV